jgi:hypothetical protein
VQNQERIMDNIDAHDIINFYTSFCDENKIAESERSMDYVKQYIIKLTRSFINLFGAEKLPRKNNKYCVSTKTAYSIATALYKNLPQVFKCDAFLCELMNFLTNEDLFSMFKNLTDNMKIMSNFNMRYMMENKRRRCESRSSESSTDEDDEKQPTKQMLEFGKLQMENENLKNELIKKNEDMNELAGKYVDIKVLNNDLTQKIKVLETIIEETKLENEKIKVLNNDLTQKKKDCENAFQEIKLENEKIKLENEKIKHELNQKNRETETMIIQEPMQKNELLDFDFQLNDQDQMFNFDNIDFTFSTKEPTELENRNVFSLPEATNLIDPSLKPKMKSKNKGKNLPDDIKQHKDIKERIFNVSKK